MLSHCHIYSPVVFSLSSVEKSDTLISDGNLRCKRMSSILLLLIHDAIANYPFMEELVQTFRYLLRGFDVYKGTGCLFLHLL